MTTLLLLLLLQSPPTTANISLSPELQKQLAELIAPVVIKLSDGMTTCQNVQAIVLVTYAPVALKVIAKCVDEKVVTPPTIKAQKGYDETLKSDKGETPARKSP